jgi:putative Ca2+/H+ antiporter (TMEM165/GDT1 family)
LKNLVESNVPISNLPELPVLELERSQPNVAAADIGIVVEVGQANDYSLREASNVARSAIAPSPKISTNKSPVSSWKIFTSTFVTIFLAELGDKTQMSTLLMSAEFHKPWVIFAGAGTALVATTLIGVLVGQWLSSRLSPRTLDVAAGILLALISVWLVWDVAQM